jgi:hypothetical protein
LLALEPAKHRLRIDGPPTLCMGINHYNQSIADTMTWFMSVGRSSSCS